MFTFLSSGIGKTGTYIAFDYLMDEAHETGQLSVQNCVMKLRNQRPLMVQTSVSIYPAERNQLIC